MIIEFGKRLKKLRLEKNLTQEQLAQRIGLTASVVSAYEIGLRYPAYDTLICLASIFGVTTDYLLCVNNIHTIDTSRLSESNLKLVSNLIDALSEKDDKVKK
ncbi:MAG: helix-turn-helix domain-containing protein [Oscillospiraceae bacterium]|nr:helix-turn-helix domain-containing protein [Oscillospiraceae bacterium]